MALLVALWYLEDIQFTGEVVAYGDNDSMIEVILNRRLRDGKKWEKMFTHEVLRISERFETIKFMRGKNTVSDKLSKQAKIQGEPIHAKGQSFVDKSRNIMMKNRRHKNRNTSVTIRSKFV